MYFISICIHLLQARMTKTLRLRLRNFLKRIRCMCVCCDSTLILKNSEIDGEAHRLSHSGNGGCREKQKGGKTSK